MAPLVTVYVPTAPAKEMPSVSATIDAAGNILFWYQNGAGWSQETAASPAQGVGYGASDLTATSTGVVIGAVGTNGVFYTFFEPYGGPTWASDGTLGVGTGQAYALPAVTWDGTHVDVAAVFNDGSGIGSGLTVRFMWKSNSAQFWSQKTLPGVTDTQGEAYAPAISWTGGNLIVAANQQLSDIKERLNFWWQHPHHLQPRSRRRRQLPGQLHLPRPGRRHPAHRRRGSLRRPFTTNGFETSALDDWTQPISGTGWTKHTINAP
jgi:hypothetical protein